MKRLIRYKKKQDRRRQRDIDRQTKEKEKEEKRICRENTRREKEVIKAQNHDARVRKQQAKNTKKSIQTTQKGKRKASLISDRDTTKKQRIVGLTDSSRVSGVDSRDQTSKTPITTRTGRAVNLPVKYR